MESDSIAKLLTECDIRPTAVRMLVARTLIDAEHPLSLAEVEESLDTAPKSTIFRALTLFLQHGLIHSIEDGSGSLKYEFHHRSGSHTPNDMHIHFYCEKCQRTYCLRNINIPTIELPAGFSMRTVNYIVKGVCEKCKSM